MKNYCVQTPWGNVWMVANTPAPKVLLIHGLLRPSHRLLAWGDVFDDFGLLLLPEHSGANALSERSVEVYTSAFREVLKVLPAPPLVIGESLGAIIALGLPAKAIVAIEPPLSEKNFWPIHRAFEVCRIRGETDGREAAFFTRSFLPELASLAVPTLVLAGDVPLGEEREFETLPSLVSDEDLATFAAHALVTAGRLPGGHLLLDQSPVAVLAAIQGFASSLAIPLGLKSHAHERAEI